MFDFLVLVPLCPGLMQHVMVRDIERKDIFLGDADRVAFRAGPAPR